MSAQLIVALDTPDAGRVAALAAALDGVVALTKIGLEAYTALGPDAVHRAAAHTPVFLDLKLHDIPNTVAGAARAAAGLGVAMLTVHASGGPAMIAAAAAAAPDVRIVAVTVLTSLSPDDLAAVGHEPAAVAVPRLAAMAVQAGARAVVCAPPEITAVRAAVGPDVALVVPGIRPAGAPADDQARTATAREAARAGADYLVVGRPITAQADPAAAARRLLAEVDG